MADQADAKVFFIGVDCGTSSIRAALVSDDGRILTTNVQPLTIWEPEEDFYEQSSDEIWTLCCRAVRTVCSGVPPGQVRGIGFDATCSLVVLDKDFQPVTVARSGEDNRNIIMWMDHRAKEQADFINSTKHAVLKYVGGSMSLEMEPPKLLWLKQNLETSWQRAGHFFDLADFLSWKATGSLSSTYVPSHMQFVGQFTAIRICSTMVYAPEDCSELSLCTLVCKWTYQADREGKRCWDESFWKQIGLEDLTRDDYCKIGNDVMSLGEPIRGGLSEKSAGELGLLEGTAVGVSLLDAHAGGVGMLGADVRGHGLPCEDRPITSRIALILGTSSCHMAISEDPLLVPGVWGPYFNTIVPGYWLSEGGQSITGKLIDHVIETHPAYNELCRTAKEWSVYDQLGHLLKSIQTSRQLPDVAHLTEDLHIWPDHHGNRSPLSDPTLKGMISGLGLGTSVENLAILYIATIQSLALGTKHILDTMMSAGHSINTLFACGGLSKNSVLLQIHSDVTGMPIVLPREEESVLVGAAILGACASSHYGSMQEAMAAMSTVGEVIRPNVGVAEYYQRKYKVFLAMVKHQKEYKEIMKT